jgi:hypothetical protein
MRISTLKLSVVGSLMAAIAMTGAASASADTTTCSASASIKLSPGLSTTPTVQNVQIKGSLSGCAGVESTMTAAKFQAHFKTAEPISCATLTSTGVGAAGEENKLIVKGTPKGAGNLMGTASLLILEGEGALSGMITSEGPFSGDTVSGSLTQAYSGGPTCGVAVGKKKAKKVTKGTLSGTVTIA